MTKNVKMLLGAAAVLGVGYYLYTKNKTTPAKASYAGPFANLAGQEECGCHKSVGEYEGDTVYTCANGNHSFKTQGPCKGSGAGRKKAEQ